MVLIKHGQLTKGKILITDEGFIKVCLKKDFGYEIINFQIRT